MPNPNPAESTVRYVHLDSCSWTRWARSPSRAAVLNRFIKRGGRFLIMLDVLHEVLRLDEDLEVHASLVRPVGGMAIPLAFDWLVGLAAGHDLTASLDEAQEVVVRSLNGRGVDPDELVHWAETAHADRAMLRATDREARDRYRSLHLTDDATIDEAAASLVRDRRLRKWAAGEICALCGSHPRGGAWWRSPSLRCWGLGWLWRAREGSIRSANRVRRRRPGWTDLIQLTLLPQCAAFVTDDHGLELAAKEVCRVGRTGRKSDPWTRPSPWIGSFDCFATKVLSGTF